MSEELIRWLRAQLDARLRELDEDERVARTATDNGDTWSASDPGIYPSNESQHPGPIVGGVWGDLEGQYAEHIARWDPKRVLREVETGRAEVDAKRQLVDDLSRELGDDDTNETARWYVQLLALPYAEREGYREEWRPSE